LIRRDGAALDRKQRMRPGLTIAALHNHALGGKKEKGRLGGLSF
jgi:hypothetical protein